MQLVINTYGSYLRKNGNCFLVKKEDKSFEVAVNKVNSILITTASYITTDAIKLAIDNNIDIVWPRKSRYKPATLPSFTMWMSGRINVSGRERPLPLRRPR
jgi:CRISPR/Cas system-associated endonuclease Cas1